MTQYMKSQIFQYAYCSYVLKDLNTVLCLNVQPLRHELLQAWTHFQEKANPFVWFLSKRRNVQQVLPLILPNVTLIVCIFLHDVYLQSIPTSPIKYNNMQGIIQHIFKLVKKNMIKNFYGCIYNRHIGMEADMPDRSKKLNCLIMLTFNNKKSIIYKI